MKSKKIVMLQDFYGLDLTYQENLLTKNYIELGHDVVLISSTFDSIFDYVNDNYDKTKKKSVLYHLGAKIIKLPYSINILNKLRKHSGVFKILESEKPDLIYAHDIHLNLKEAVKYVKKNPSCKIIMDYHADFSNSANGWISLNILHKVIRKSFFKRYAKYIDRIYPVVPASADFLNKVYQVPYSKMQLLPLGYDHLQSMEARKNADVNFLREQIGITNCDFVIITGGKIDPLKKTHLLIEAIKKINDPKIKLIVFGKSPENQSEYEELLKSIAQKSNVHFTGWLNNNSVLELMTIANLGVFPSSQSVIWQQSIGMHLPLILGNSGDQSAEYLNLHSNIISLNKNEITSQNIAKVIIDLKNNAEMLKNMKKGAEKVAIEYLDYKIICNTTLEVLNPSKQI